MHDPRAPKTRLRARRERAVAAAAGSASAPSPAAHGGVRTRSCAAAQNAPPTPHGCGSSTDGSSSDEDDRRPARFGGCAHQGAPRKRRRVDDDKENVAPVRAVTPRVLAVEERMRRVADGDPRAPATPRRSPRQPRVVTAPRAAAPPSTASVSPASSAGTLSPFFPADASPLHTPQTTPSSTPRAKTAPGGASASPLRTPRGHAAGADAGISPHPPAFSNVYMHARALLRGAVPGAAHAAAVIGRDTERAQMHAFLDRAGTAGDAPRCMYVSGLPGTGKTALVQSVLRERTTALEYATVRVATVNCVALSHPNQVAGEIGSRLGLSADAVPDVEALERMLASCIPADPLVLVLDEMDHLMHTRVHQNVLYHLFCLPSRLQARDSGARVALIGMANSLDLTERFVPLLNSRGIKPELLPFAPLPAGGVVEIVPLELLARKLAAASGDVRRALDTGRQALDLVEAEVRARGAPLPSSVEAAAPVTPAHILRVLAHMAGHAQIARVRALGVHAKLLLLAWIVVQMRVEAGLSPVPRAGGAANGAHGSGAPTPPASDGSVRSTELEMTYQAVLRYDGGFVSPLESSELLDVLERLEVQGLARLYAEATGGSTPQAFSKGGGARAPAVPALRVSPSGKRAMKKQLLAANRRMAPSLDRELLCKALTTGASAAPDAQHSQTVVDAMARILRREDDEIARITLWRTSAPRQQQTRDEELGGGRVGVPM
ncbi:AAA ATPase [Malassezia sp. CBS 17886]|nr:AAA ATPase [Malassezia sp. CBS 17886]